MRVLIKRLLNKIWKPKPFLVDEKYKVVPAFELAGEVYYTHSDPVNTATGRGLSFMQASEELIMRCSADYLLAHIEAVEKIISHPKRIDLAQLFKLHENLKERVNLLIALPDHIYKLAAVVYFTKDESPYKYDRIAGKKKMELFRKSPGMYDFFLQGRLDRLLPFLVLPEEGSEKYLEIAEKINDMHLKSLQRVLLDHTRTQGIRS